LDGEDHAYQEDRKRKLKQQDGRERHPLEQQQVEQRIEPQFVWSQQFQQEQLQPQQPSLASVGFKLSARAAPGRFFVCGKVRLFLFATSH